MSAFPYRRVLAGLQLLLRPALACLASLASAASGAEQVAPYDSETTAAIPLPAREALKRLSVPAGFRATLFAAEPQVRNPIALAWDSKGRLWVAENQTYAEPPLRFEARLRDRILILEDRDSDGVAESIRVFADDLSGLTSIELGRGGVWALCPPRLLFIPDADADDRPDGPPETRLDGFTVADHNYHNFANGLRWGPDNWLYGRCGHSCPGRIGAPGSPAAARIPIQGGIWRYHPGRKTVEVVAHGTTNPWGLDWDEHGEGFFVNSVNGHLWHLIPGAHYKQSSRGRNPLVYERIDMHADHSHFDTRHGLTEARYGKADLHGGGHVHAGAMIYQADQWPREWRNRLFTWNFHGRRANVEQLERVGSGFVGRHVADLLLSGDPGMRGIDLSTGPDGSVYLLDWSDTGECHERSGVHRSSGRIFKVSHGTPRPPDLGDLARLSPEGAVRLIQHSNAWFDRRMREQVAGRGRPELEVPLRAVLATDRNTGARLRALWALNAMGALRDEELQALLRDPAEAVRVWAVRLLTDASALDTLEGTVTAAPLAADLVAHFVRMARSDPSGLVRLALASMLQRLPLAQRKDLARALAARAEDANDQNLPPLVWYGLAPLTAVEPGTLVEFAAASEWPALWRWSARCLAAQVESRPELLDALLKRAMVAPPLISGNVVRGISEALKGWSRAPKPPAWDDFVRRHKPHGDDAVLNDLSVLFGDGTTLAVLEREARSPAIALGRRQAALQSLIDARAPGLRQICEGLVEHRVLAPLAVRGLARSGDPEVGSWLAARLRNLPPAAQSAAIDALVSRPAWAEILVAHLAGDAGLRARFTGHHARQILALEVPGLAQRLAEAWGEVRATPRQKQERIAALKARLTAEVLARANRSRGRASFDARCAACHTLHGVGGKIGPDLTGSGRADLDYLLENIIDPGAVVATEYRIVSLQLRDGRNLTGMLAAETDRTLTLRQPEGEETVALADISRRTATAVSMMPDGLLDQLADEDIRDLVAYLQHPSQVPREPAAPR